LASRLIISILRLVPGMSEGVKQWAIALARALLNRENHEECHLAVSSNVLQTVWAFKLKKP
jgi:hypothetical protein